MNHEDLLLAVLYESSSQEPVAPELFKDMPQVRVVEPRIAPEAFLSQPQGVRPHVVLIILKGENAIPDWLDELLKSYPPGAVIVSSAPEPRVIQSTWCGSGPPLFGTEK